MFVSRAVRLVQHYFPGNGPRRFGALHGGLVSTLPRCSSHGVSALFRRALISSIASEYSVANPTCYVSENSVSSRTTVRTTYSSLLANEVSVTLTKNVRKLLAPRLLVLCSHLKCLSGSKMTHPCKDGTSKAILNRNNNFLILGHLSSTLGDNSHVCTIVPTYTITSSNGTRGARKKLTTTVGRIGTETPRDSTGVSFVRTGNANVPTLSGTRLGIVTSSIVNRDGLPLSAVPLKDIGTLVKGYNTTSNATKMVGTTLSLCREVVPPTRRTGSPTLSLGLGRDPLCLGAHPHP